MRPRREQVLDTLRAAAEPMTIRQVADALGVHPNTARFHLDGLEAEGVVERVPGHSSSAPRAAAGRPPLRYRVVPGVDGSPTDYRLLADILASSMTTRQARARAVEAARQWGERLAEADPDPAEDPDRGPVDRLMDLMSSLGFAPQERRGTTGAIELHLRHCAFGGLIESRGEVICPLHLGLMQGAMGAFGGPMDVARLEPLVEPHRCVAHLGLRAQRRSARTAAS